MLPRVIRSVAVWPGSWAWRRPGRSGAHHVQQEGAGPTAWQLTSAQVTMRAYCSNRQRPLTWENHAHPHDRRRRRRFLCRPSSGARRDFRPSAVADSRRCSAQALVDRIGDDRFSAMALDARTHRRGLTRAASTASPRAQRRRPTVVVDIFEGAFPAGAGDYLGYGHEPVVKHSDKPTNSRA